MQGVCGVPVCLFGVLFCVLTLLQRGFKVRHQDYNDHFETNVPE